MLWDVLFHPFLIYTFQTCKYIFACILCRADTINRSMIWDVLFHVFQICTCQTCKCIFACILSNIRKLSQALKHGKHPNKQVCSDGAQGGWHTSFVVSMRLWLKSFEHWTITISRPYYHLWQWCPHDVSFLHLGSWTSTFPQLRTIKSGDKIVSLIWIHAVWLTENCEAAPK